jgi:ABC-type multidrug transport system fused ATPase/permease subunit
MGKLARIIWPMTTRMFRWKITILTIFSLLISFLDAVALYLFARVFSSIAQTNSEFVNEFLAFFGLNDAIRSVKSGYIAIISAVLCLFLAKSIGTLLISRKILRLLSQFYARLTDRFILSYYSSQVTVIKSRANFEIFMALNTGLKDLFMIGIFSYSLFSVEIVVLTVLLLLVVLNGGLAVIGLMVFFILVLIVTNRYTTKLTQSNSAKSTKALFNGSIAIQTLTESIREIKLAGTLNRYIGVHRAAVDESAEAAVELQTNSIIPKLVLETSFMFAVALYTLWHIIFGELSEAIVSVTFVVAFGSRIIPTLLRLQSSYNSLKQVVGSSSLSIDLIHDMRFAEPAALMLSNISSTHDCDNFTSSISLNEVSFTYSKNSPAAVNDVSFHLEKGQSLGIVGYAGSGKSTVADLILGFIEPDIGESSISGIPASEAMICCGRRIGYVPQSVSLIDGTLKQNILLGRSESLFTESDLHKAITFAGLTDFISSLDHGLDHVITRAGSELSGGQRQKIGIARAVLSAPEILVFDEPTSSLDSDSESHLSAVIQSILGKVTLVIISHRLTTIKFLERIAVMDAGKLVALDTYETLEQENAIFRSFVKNSSL